MISGKDSAKVAHGANSWLFRGDGESVIDQGNNPSWNP
jgi:hypothetical protein